MKFSRTWIANVGKFFRGGQAYEVETRKHSDDTTLVELCVERLVLLVFFHGGDANGGVMEYNSIRLPPASEEDTY